MADAPTLKEPTGTTAGGAQKWGGPDAKHCAELIKGTHSTEKIQAVALDGSLIFAKVVKSVDETINSSIALQNDNELKATLRVNKVYSLQMFILLNSVAAANFKYNFTLPTGATGRRTTAGASANTPQTTADITAELITSATDATDQQLRLYGFITMGGTAGDLQFQWAQNVSDAGNTTVKARSTLLVWEE